MCDVGCLLVDILFVALIESPKNNKLDTFYSILSSIQIVQLSISYTFNYP